MQNQQTEQMIKDLQFLKWNLENSPEKLGMILDIVIKRYSPKDKIADIGDPADSNMCDSCQ